jgi:hypothetical protein
MLEQTDISETKSPPLKSDSVKVIEEQEKIVESIKKLVDTDRKSILTKGKILCGYRDKIRGLENVTMEQLYPKLPMSRTEALECMALYEDEFFHRKEVQTLIGGSRSLWTAIHQLSKEGKEALLLGNDYFPVEGKMQKLGLNPRLTISQIELFKKKYLTPEQETKQKKADGKKAVETLTTEILEEIAIGDITADDNAGAEINKRIDKLLADDKLDHETVSDLLPALRKKIKDSFERGTETDEEVFQIISKIPAITGDPIGLEEIAKYTPLTEDEIYKSVKRLLNSNRIRNNDSGYNDLYIPSSESDEMPDETTSDETPEPARQTAAPDIRAQMRAVSGSSRRGFTDGGKTTEVKMAASIVDGILTLNFESGIYEEYRNEFATMIEILNSNLDRYPRIKGVAIESL